MKSVKMVKRAVKLCEMIDPALVLYLKQDRSDTHLCLQNLLRDRFLMHARRRTTYVTPPASRREALLSVHDKRPPLKL